MTQNQLIEEIQVFLAKPKVNSVEYLEELNRYYFYVTGEVVKCKPCKTVERLKSIKNYLLKPFEPYTFTPITITTMAKTNISKKYALVNPATTITMRTGKRGDFVNISKDNLTDELAEAVLANEKYAHNIKTISNPESETATEDPAQGRGVVATKGARTKSE